ncbi:RNA-directed DNA polymerase, eukaryota, reverse transcriptase zinc-binding domain protein [Tanacetum coccineum]
MKRKRKKLAVSGITAKGLWVTNPSQVKSIFLEFFQDKFKPIECASISQPSNHLKQLSSNQVDYLSSYFSKTEIKDAIWSCGNEKSPCPDGFSFRFNKHFWELIKVVVFAFVHEFFNSSHIPRGYNSSFITLIPKKDNPMNVKDYHPISLIGIQYKVLAKILANRLASVIDSVISNEQSAFIKGRQILDGPLMINEIVEWFSGLQINIQKSNLYGIGIHLDELTRMARITGCNSSTLPFTSLGLPVGLNMHHSANWSPIIGKVRKRLSTWKANLMPPTCLCSRLLLNFITLSNLFVQLFSGELSFTNGDGGMFIVKIPYGLKFLKLYMVINPMVCIPHLKQTMVEFGLLLIETDNWLEGITLQCRFPRLYALETFKKCTCAERYLNGVWNWKWRRNPRNGIESSQVLVLMDAHNVSFNDGADKWIWNIDNSHVFSVSNARHLIDNANLTPGNRPTKWSKYVPIKINIFAWRLLLNRLPTKINLSDRDIDVLNIMCSTCNQAQEDVSHIFIHYGVAS